MQYYFRLAFIAWVASLAWAALFIGLLPDDLLGSQPLFRLSDQHGPSTIDAVGVVPAVIVTVYYLWCVWRFRKNLTKRHYMWVCMWAMAAIVTIFAVRLNLNALLLVSIVLSVVSLLLLGGDASGILKLPRRKKT